MRRRAAAAPRLTRRQVLLPAAAGSAVLAGGVWAAEHRDMRASAAEPSAATDAKILGVFLLLEQVQEAFYDHALSTGRLAAELREFAQAAREQERAHVAFLAERLKAGAAPPPPRAFDDAVSTPQRFASNAVELEEAAVACYIGQGANLTRSTVASVAPMVSVEARQAAWIRDLAGQDPAPHAADPARPADQVIAELRRKGFVA